MTSRLFTWTLLFSLVLIASCCMPWMDCADECDELDEFGDELILEVPVTISPNRETFRIGDTIYIDFDFSKNVSVYNSDGSLFVEDFNFFVEVRISEIVDTTEIAVGAIQLFEEVGEIDTLVLVGGTVFPITFEETDTSYAFKLKIVMTNTGEYHLRLGFSQVGAGRSNHPILFRCEGVKRETFRTHVYNVNASPERIQRYVIDRLYYYDDDDMERLLSFGSFPFVVTD